MKNKLKLSSMFIEQLEDKVRICSNIKTDSIEYKLWYEIDEKYKEYVLMERLDAFLVAILPYAIKRELDIIVEGKVSERLYYQLNTYLIPMLCNELGKKVINIEVELDSKSYGKGNAVGTGISCGVDSLYTILKHTNRTENLYNITHLTFFNVGANGSLGGEKALKNYEERLKNSMKFANENGFEIVTVNSNLSELLLMRHETTHTFRSLSCALLLQKLFKTYYYSSGISFNETCINEEDTAYYDILNMQCLSTENITFYSTGLETNRMGKVKFVSEYEPSYEVLNVCLGEFENCGKCEKCLRTMIQLDSIGKLEAYEKVFDIDEFKKNRFNNYIFMLRMMKDKKDRHSEFYLSAYEEYKKRGVRIPILCKLISYIPSKVIFKKKLRRFLQRFISKEKWCKIRDKKDGWRY